MNFVFAGDMNYRINLHRPTAIQMIQDKDFARLLEADQLITKLKKDPSHRLCIFQEAKIDFCLHTSLMSEQIPMTLRKSGAFLRGVIGFSIGAAMTA